MLYQTTDITESIQRSFLWACTAEVMVLKSGNVSVFSSHKDMGFLDFIKSATAIIEPLSYPQLSVGERILESIKQTRQQVSINTNLGIVLLAAPLALAAQINGENLQTTLSTVLANLTQRDAEQTYEAIRIANPSGLGDSNQQDVKNKPTVNLQQAMSLAAEQDLIARQYCNNFNEIFDFGLSLFKTAYKQHNNLFWTIVQLYLHFLSTFNDSHIERKHGYEVANAIRIRANKILNIYLYEPSISYRWSLINDFDCELKNKQLNPGTSADLVVCTLMVTKLLDE